MSVTPRAVARPTGSARGMVRWYYVVPTLFVLQAVGMADKVNVGIVMAFHPFQQSMGLIDRPAMAGLLMTWFLVAYGVGMPIWGFICDRIGPRAASAYALIGWTLMLVLGGVAPNLTVLYISRIGLGLAEAVIWPVANKLTSQWFPVDERSRSSGIWISGINFGIVIAGLLVPPVIIGFGWRAIFFVLGAIGLIPLAMMVFLTRDNPRQLKRVSEAEADYIDSGMLERADAIPMHEQNAHTVVFRNYRFWLVTVANIATGMSVFGINTWLPSYLTKVRDMTLTGAGTFTAVAWLLCMAVIVLIGMWSDRIVRRAPFGLVAYVIFAAALWAATVVQTPTAALLLIGLAIFALQTTTVSVFSLLHSLGGSGTMGNASGWMAGLSNFIGAFAPLIVGMILAATHSWEASFSLFWGMALLSAVLMGILIPQGY